MVSTVPFQAPETCRFKNIDDEHHGVRTLLHRFEAGKRSRTMFLFLVGTLFFSHTSVVAAQNDDECSDKISSAWLSFSSPSLSCASARDVATKGKPLSPSDLGITSAKQSESSSEQEDEDHDGSQHPPSVYQAISTFFYRLQQGLRKMVGAVILAFGFGQSAAISMVANPFSTDTMDKNLEAMDNFLRRSGIEDELTGVANWKASILDLAIVLSKIQFEYIRGADIRDQVLIDSDKPEPIWRNKPSSTKPFKSWMRNLAGSSRQASIPTAEEGYRYMKYATAAYGESAILAARMVVSGHVDARGPGEWTRVRIAEHVGIESQDIALMDVHYDGDPDIMRHFVAVDHANKAIVLAIRGTFSISELVVDIAAFSRPFCGGEAHSEMANMAERLWKVTSATIRTLLRENTGYELVLTGHSLGGGVAGLLNILLHENNRERLGGRHVRCILFASPPVFFSRTEEEHEVKSLEEAIRYSTNFIYGVDVVPFLSVNAVRQALASLKAIEQVFPQFTFEKWNGILLGLKDLPEFLVEAVMEANDKKLEPKAGAPPLLVPASHNIWIMKEEEKTHGGGRDVFSAKDCQSERLAHLGIQFSLDMLNDHFPTEYEPALYHMSRQESEHEEHLL